MRNRTLSLLITLLTAATVRAAGIRYEQIPADAGGYEHIDWDRLPSLRFVRQRYSGDEIKMFAQQLNATFGEHADFTIYQSKSGGPTGYVMLWHTRDLNIRKRLQTTIAGAKTTVTITYGQEEIHYATASLSQLLNAPFLWRLPQSKKAAKKPAEPVNKPYSHLSIGMGISQEIESDIINGPSYTAFVDQDLIVVAGDLPSIANALDVIHGKIPSLAKQDPQGLKVDAPPGVIALCAGATAEFSMDNPDKANDHSTEAASDDAQPPKAGGVSSSLGLDMFGSLEANARLARFDMGEDDTQDYMDGWIAMKDAASAEQMKNLITGVTALISLTHETAKPLLDPLEIKTADRTVMLHWSWPVAKIPELYRLMEAQSEHDNSSPATAPATLPAH